MVTGTLVPWSDETSRPGARMLAITHDLGAIYPNVMHTGGQLVWFLERGVIGDGFGIKNDYIGEHIFPQQTTVAKAQTIGDG